MAWYYAWNRYIKKLLIFRYNLREKIPIVLTGAMRSSNEIGSDGLYNFISAIWTACSDESYDKGVLVVMNDEIHTGALCDKTQRT